MKTLKKPGLYFGIVALLLSAFLFLSLIRLNVLPTMFVGMIRGFIVDCGMPGLFTSL